MLSDDDVRRVARSLPGVSPDGDPAELRFAFAGKSVCWPYLRRDRPRAPRRAVPGVLAVRCPLETKEMLIGARPEAFFDDDHYRGSPGVLVRLAAIDEAELAARLRQACEAVAASRPRRRH